MVAKLAIATLVVLSHEWRRHRSWAWNHRELGLTASLRVPGAHGNQLHGV